MNPKGSSPQKPSLPLDVLVAIGDTNRKVKQLLQECHVLPDPIVVMEQDVLEATEIMRVGASEAFKTRIKYYASQAGFCRAWLYEAADETVVATFALVPPFLARGLFLERVPATREELRKVLEAHIEEQVNSIDTQELGSTARPIRSTESLEACSSADMSYNQRPGLIEFGPTTQEPLRDAGPPAQPQRPNPISRTVEMGGRPSYLDLLPFPRGNAAAPP